MYHFLGYFLLIKNLYPSNKFGILIYEIFQFITGLQKILKTYFLHEN